MWESWRRVSTPFKAHKIIWFAFIKMVIRFVGPPYGAKAIVIGNPVATSSEQAELL